MPTIPLRRGDDLALKATFTDKVSGEAADLTGWSISATMRFSNCPPVELTAAFVSPSTGEAGIELPDTETLNLKVGEHTLRVRLTNPAGVDVSAPSAIILVAD
jgi:hypothetical protein